MIPSLLGWLISALKTRRSLALENLALRHQLAVLHRSVKRPRLSKVDRGFWVLLRRFWTEWNRVLVVVKPETVVRWHRAGFKRYWTWKSRQRGPGRPAVAPDVRELIRSMSRSNPLWGAPRIHGELTKLGISISQAAVSKLSLLFIRPGARQLIFHRNPRDHACMIPSLLGWFISALTTRRSLALENLAVPSVYSSGGCSPQKIDPAGRFGR